MRRIGPCFLKTFRESLREWKILSFALVFGPFFVYLMFAYFGAATPSYDLLVTNADEGAPRPEGGRREAGRELRAAWEALRYPDGTPVFRVRDAAGDAEAERRLKSRDADLHVRIPGGFSRSLEARRADPSAPVVPVTNAGDEASVRFVVAVSFADMATYRYVAEAAGLDLPALVEFRPLGGARSLRDFDLYVPALLVLSIIMVLFTAAASLIKEVDKGTIVRLRLAPLTTFELLGAISLDQLLIGTAGLALTWGAALSVGYRGRGAAALVLLAGALSILSVLAISLIVAGCLRTIFELLTVGVFPFFVLMFFSETMFPLPKLGLLSLAGHPFYVNDLLPTALTVRVFNKILNFGAGFGDVALELGGIAVLTLAYGALGLAIFRRRHMTAR